jgi:uncharacterized membrane protein SpoIIM required for sporulation
MALLILGVIGILLGPILWNMGSQQLSHDQEVADLTHAMGLDNGINIAATSPAVSADHVLIGFGIGVLALGVLLLVAFVIIAALRPGTTAP